MDGLGPWEWEDQCALMAARTLTPGAKAVIRAEILGAVRDGSALLDATKATFFRSVTSAVNRLARDPDIERAKAEIAGGARVAETLLEFRLSYDDYRDIAEALSKDSRPP